MRWVTAASLSPTRDAAEAEVHLPAGCPFVRDGLLVPAALIECMAQGAAAGSALKAMAAGRRVRRGVLVAIKHFAVHRPVPAGPDGRCRLRVTATHEMSLGPLSQARLEAFRDNDRVPAATARMTFHIEFE
jgi:predicted hotdog family 3-hydroxylacyl-ACP dehydratase